MRLAEPSLAALFQQEGPNRQMDNCIYQLPNGLLFFFSTSLLLDFRKPLSFKTSSVIFRTWVGIPHLNSLWINKRFSFEVLEMANTDIIWLITWFILTNPFWKIASHFWGFFWVTDLGAILHLLLQLKRVATLLYTIYFNRKMSWAALWFCCAPRPSQSHNQWSKMSIFHG